jgi:hypothetical protein
MVGHRLIKMVHCIALITMVLMFSCGDSFAALKTFEKEYTYQASEIDSKVSCRTIAMEQVKRLLLEELGTFLISETQVKDLC